MNNFEKNPNKLNYLYLLTPSGIKEKIILTKDFLKRKMDEYQNLKKEIKKIRDKRRELKRLKKQGKLQEQVFEGIMIGTLFLSTSALLAIGGLIIITIIIIVLLKNGKSGSRCGNPFDRL